MGTRLYVGNLPYDVDEDSIKQFFEGGGGRQVKQVKIVTDRDTGRPRGFAFVEMADDAQAQSAINELNGQSLGGRTIVVNEAREPQRGGRGGGGRRRGGGYGGGGGGGGYGGRGGGGGGGRAAAAAVAAATAAAAAAAGTAAAAAATTTRCASPAQPDAADDGGEPDRIRQHEVGSQARHAPASTSRAISYS